MDLTVIDDVTVLPGGGRAPQPASRVVLDADGVVREIVPGAVTGDRYLVPAAVDLHLDTMSTRRRPRATVELPQAAVVAVLDAECAAAGIGTVCIAAHAEDAPGKGIRMADALDLARVVEELAPHLACDWRLHVRVEVTDEGAVETLEEVLALSSRVALISMMEHSPERSRFATPEEDRAFYAADWGVPPSEVDAILARKAAGLELRDERRAQVAAVARAAGIVLACHDDATPADVEDGHALGAQVAEFPLSEAAARRARELGMRTVLGSPNAVRGRSTAPGNLLVADAVRAGVCDVLCSDYLPSAIQAAPRALDRAGVAPWHEAVDLVSTAPAALLGLASPEIVVGQPLTASLRLVRDGVDVGLGLWRSGRRTFRRDAAPSADAAVLAASRPELAGTTA